MADISKLLEEVSLDHVTQILKEKFAIERMYKFFQVNNTYSYTSSIDNLTLGTNNSIFIEFETLNNSTKYNLLVIFSLFKETNFNLKLINELKIISDNNIDKIIIWNMANIPTEVIANLKSINIDILQISHPEIKSVGVISYFFPLEEVSYDYAVVVNKLTDLLTKRLKKLFHLVLSEIAAPIYDEDYGKGRYGTSSAMNFEIGIIDELAKRITGIKKQLSVEQSEKTIAVDVGCGTGRHSFDLSKHFDKIYAFDFSPKMIEKARKKKKELNNKNVIFSVSDLEYETYAHHNELKEKSDLVVASFGMGSFIENTQQMLKIFHEWLKPGGYVVLSFYNSNSILLKVTPDWRDTALSALIDSDNKTLQVQLRPEIIFSIYCKPYDKNVLISIKDLFKVENLYTFPTSMALLPNNLLENKLVRELFTEFDNYISESEKFKFGHYVTIVAKKSGYSSQEKKVESAYENISKILKEGDFTYEFIEHDFVVSINDVRREIGDFPNQMIKSIVLKNKTSGEFYFLATLAEKRLNKDLFATQINLTENELKFASQKEVINFGFPVGGVAPFGALTTTKNLKLYIDKDISESKVDFFFMGSGDNTKTLKIKSKDFLTITEKYIKVQIA